MDSMSDTGSRVIVVLVFLLMLYSILMWNAEINQKIKLENENTRLIDKVDSLENENYVLQLKLFRYERAYKIFEERNPKSSSQLGDIISDETE